MTRLSSDSFPPDVRKLFPIPLEPFEEYLLRDESRRFPMTWIYECHFEGRVDRKILEAAFHETLLYEPLLWAKVRRKNFRYVWVPADPLPELLWRDHPDEAKGLPESGKINMIAMNATDGPVMRVEIDRYDNRLIMRWSVHHAVADGLGIARFIANWLSVYANMLGDTDGVKPFFARPERITDRGRLNITLPEPVSFSTAVRSLAREVINWFRRRPVCLERTPIRNAKTSMSGPVGLSILLWRQLSPELARAYRDRAKTLEISVNSLFLGDMFLFLKSWCMENHVSMKKQRSFRILVPVNMRNAFHEDIPASNILGYVFLERSPEQCVDEKDFMAAIDRDVKFIRDWSIGSMFLDGVRFFRRIPFALSFLASPRFCHSTTVVSNPGPFCLALPQERFRREKTIRVAELELKQVIGAPPVRPHTPVSLGIVTCDDRMIVSVVAEKSYDERGMADRFLEGFIDRLEQRVKGATHDAS